MLRSLFINTSLQRGGCACREVLNRFSGFHAAAELHATPKTAKAVLLLTPRPTTPLKRCVNERSSALRRFISFAMRHLLPTANIFALFAFFAVNLSDRKSVV